MSQSSAERQFEWVCAFWFYNSRLNTDTHCQINCEFVSVTLKIRKVTSFFSPLVNKQAIMKEELTEGGN
jgi:hypothetical protein